MSQTITGPVPYNAPYFYAQAMPGMKADSMDDNVESWACGAAPIGFGLICGRTATGAMTIIPGGPAPLLIGASIHDHVIASRGGYTQYDAVSILTRGRVWCVVDVATGVADGAPVFYSAATGAVNNTNTNVALVNAVFRSGVASVFALLGGAPATVAIVEMHYPLV